MLIEGLPTLFSSSARSMPITMAPKSGGVAEARGISEEAVVVARAVVAGGAVVSGAVWTAVAAWSGLAAPDSELVSLSKILDADLPAAPAAAVVAAERPARPPYSTD